MKMNLRKYLSWFWSGLRTGATLTMASYLFLQHVVGVKWPEHGLLLLFLYSIAFAAMAAFVLGPNYRSPWRRVFLGVGAILLAATLRLQTWQLSGTREVFRAILTATIVIAVILPISFFIGDCLMKRQVERINRDLERLNRK